MNREEAFKYFNYLYQYVTTKDGIEAYQIALSALLGHQPDPITGLVPCGCGGKAAYESDDMVEFRAFCTECEMHTDAAETKEKAKELWNRAMGHKGGAE